MSADVERLFDELQGTREELQRVREELHRQEGFLAVVAHELRNPLSPILISLDALLLHVADADLDRDTLLRRLDAMRRYVDGMRLHLDRLTDFSRLRAGRIDLVLEEVDLSAQTAAVLDDMAPLIHAAGCELRTSFATPLVGHWDKTRLRQVIWNLVSNAAKYAANAPIDVTTTSENDLAILTVADHGPGIAEHDRELVFARFERTPAGQHHTGFGVGLWLVRRLAEALGGSISLASMLGAGSTFSVTLPTRGP